MAHILKIKKSQNTVALTTEVTSLREAVDIYVQRRNESGEGASTFPDGIIKWDGGWTYRISYNGKVWSGDTLVEDLVQ